MDGPAERWAASHAEGLLGEQGDEAAREVVAAGLMPRLVAPGTALTMEYRPTRLTLVTDQAGAVVRVLAG